MHSYKITLKSIPPAEPYSMIKSVSANDWDVSLDGFVEFTNDDDETIYAVSKDAVISVERGY